MYRGLFAGVAYEQLPIAATRTFYSIKNDAKRA